MSTAAQDPAPASHRRSDLVVVVLIVGFIAVIGLLAFWGAFFASDAPDAPTLDNALQVLTPDASPAP